MHPLRRRQLFASGAAALGAAIALPADGEANVLGSASSDQQVLGRLVEIEQLVVSGYLRVLDAGVLSPAGRIIASRFVEHERAHVRVLSAELGGPPRRAPRTTLSELGVSGSIDNSPAGVHYLIALESLTESAYYAAIARLTNPRLLRLAGELMACEAQHWTSLSGLLHSGDVYAGVPQPVVTGG